jgi:hypothetical protein
VWNSEQHSSSTVIPKNRMKWPMKHAPVILPYPSARKDCTE